MLNHREEVGIVSFETLPGSFSNEVAMNICFGLVNDLRSPIIAALEPSKMLIACKTQLIPDNSVNFIANIDRTTHGEMNLIN